MNELDREKLLGGNDAIWIVKFPIYKHYKESMQQVKRLARRSHLKIIDYKYSKNIDPELITSKPPKLTELSIETNLDKKQQSQEEANRAIEEAKRLAAAADEAVRQEREKVALEAKTYKK